MAMQPHYVAFTCTEEIDRDKSNCLLGISDGDQVFISFIRHLVILLNSEHGEVKVFLFKQP